MIAYRTELTTYYTNLLKENTSGDITPTKLKESFAKLDTLLNSLIDNHASLDTFITDTTELFLDTANKEVTATQQFHNIVASSVYLKAPRIRLGNIDITTDSHTLFIENPITNSRASVPYVPVDPILGSGKPMYDKYGEYVDYLDGSVSSNELTGKRITYTYVVDRDIWVIGLRLYVINPSLNQPLRATFIISDPDTGEIIYNHTPNANDEWTTIVNESNGSMYVETHRPVSLRNGQELKMDIYFNYDARVQASIIQDHNNPNMQKAIAKVTYCGYPITSTTLSSIEDVTTIIQSTDLLEEELKDLDVNTLVQVAADGKSFTDAPVKISKDENDFIVLDIAGKVVADAFGFTAGDSQLIIDGTNVILDKGEKAERLQLSVENTASGTVPVTVPTLGIFKDMVGNSVTTGRLDIGVPVFSEYSLDDVVSLRGIQIIAMDLGIIHWEVTGDPHDGDAYSDVLRQQGEFHVKAMHLTIPYYIPLPSPMLVTGTVRVGLRSDDSDVLGGEAATDEWFYGRGTVPYMKLTVQNYIDKPLVNFVGTSTDPVNGDFIIEHPYDYVVNTSSGTVIADIALDDPPWQFTITDSDHTWSNAKLVSVQFEGSVNLITLTSSDRGTTVLFTLEGNKYRVSVGGKFITYLER